MQRFDDNKGERRLLDIKNMEVEEVDDYYLQHFKLSKTEKSNREKELRARIKKAESNEWILAIKSKEGKVIGKIEVWDTGAGTAYVTINLPNDNWKRKYGLEAIDQFIKICKENAYFSKIELEKKNSINKKYVAEHGLVDFRIKVA